VEEAVEQLSACSHPGFNSFGNVVRLNRDKYLSVGIIFVAE